MLNIDKLALSKAIKDKAVAEARRGLEPGIYPIDMQVRVNGVLTINEDEKYIPTASIPVKAALALFIRYCGVTREAAKAALLRSMTEALRREEKGFEKTVTILEELEETRVIDDCMTQVMELCAQLPEQTRKGKVLTDLTVTPI